MTLPDMAAISTIGQFILFVVSLGLIWIQLRQNVKLKRASNTQALAEQAGQFNTLLIQDADIARIWYSYGRGLDDEAFSEIAGPQRYRELLVQWLILHENIFYQKRSDLMDDDVYVGWDRDLRSTLAKHDVGVIASDLADVFPGAYGEHLHKIAPKETSLLNHGTETT